MPGLQDAQHNTHTPRHGQRPAAGLATRPLGRCDTAARALRHGRWGAATRRWGAGHEARTRSAATWQLSLRHGQGLGHDTAGSRPQHCHGAQPWARLGASWASWVFCAPGLVFDLVFDSVLFLSHRLDPVHEHCSSQIFSKKKIILNLIKIK